MASFTQIPIFFLSIIYKIILLTFESGVRMTLSRVSYSFVVSLLMSVFAVNPVYWPVAWLVGTFGTLLVSCYSQGYVVWLASWIFDVRAADPYYWLRLFLGTLSLLGYSFETVEVMVTCLVGFCYFPISFVGGLFYSLYVILPAALTAAILFGVTSMFFLYSFLLFGFLVLFLSLLTLFLSGLLLSTRTSSDKLSVTISVLEYLPGAVPSYFLGFHLMGLKVFLAYCASIQVYLTQLTLKFRESWGFVKRFSVTDTFDDFLHFVERLPPPISVSVYFLISWGLHFSPFPTALHYRVAKRAISSVGVRLLIIFLILMSPVFGVVLIVVLALFAVYIGISNGIMPALAVFFAQYFQLDFNKGEFYKAFKSVPIYVKVLYARAMLFVLPPDFSLSYFVNGEQLTWTFRDDLDETCLPLLNALWNYRSSIFQNIYVFCVTLWLFFAFLVLFATSTLIRVLRLTGSFLKRLVFAFGVALFLPDYFIFYFLGWINYIFLFSSAWILYITTDAHLAGSVFQTLHRRYQNVINFVGLLVLFRVSPHPDLDVDEVLQKYDLRPEHRERKIDIIRRNVNRFWRSVDGLALPEFIEGSYQSPTPENIRETYGILQQIGVPGITTEFIDSIQSPSDDPYMASWSGITPMFSAATDYAFGPFRLAAKVFAEIENFSGFGPPGYIHTGTYNTIEAEYASTSRYWSDSDATEFNDVPFLDVLDDVWDVVKAQYEDSKLATFEYIYDRWVKKYNLGFGFAFVRRGAAGKQSKTPLKRRVAIREVGGKQAFLMLWSRVFRQAPRLVHISTVFTKMESLKIKKALSNSVRTVLSSSFTHGVMSSVYNYLPNHNYKIWETPMKVGMAAKASDYGRLWSTVSSHTYVWAGDMTAFDSSLPPIVINLISEVRKRGFSSHADHAKICQLIDISYDTLLKHPLGYRSTGKVLPKAQGFTTGHSATTPDNSLALVVVYLFAWRRITGLRAKEFMMYNTLANFGDDHILGWDPVFGWDPAKAANVMKELGVLMRDEAPGQVFLPGCVDQHHKSLFLDLHYRRNPSATSEDGEAAWVEWVRSCNTPGQLEFSFLAKKPILTSSVALELAEFNIKYTHPYTTVHDRDRLLGKIKGQTPVRSTPDQRAARLISLMDLCVHHKDVYLMLRASLHSLFQVESSWFSKSKFKTKPPSYKQVVEKFYTGSTKVAMVDDAIEEDYKSDSINMAATRIYGTPSFSDLFVRWAADVPTIFSPRVVGNLWTDWLVSRVPHLFSWPSDLHYVSNGLVGQPSEFVMREMASRTPYSFIRPIDAYKVGINGPISKTTLYVRHWLFMIINLLFPARRSFSYLALLASLDRFVVNFNYFLTGKQEPVVVEVEVDLFGHFVIACLSAVHIPTLSFDLDFTGYIFPPPSRIVAFGIDKLLKSISPLGAVDHQPLVAEVQAIAPGKPLLFSAPTGIGKSTRLIVTMFEASKRKVVVILPRRLLVLTTTPYMARSYPHLSFGAGTEGGHVPRDWDILYCTPQYALLTTLPADCLYVVDEAHVYEPPHVLMGRKLMDERRLTIFMTATPPEYLATEVSNRLALPCVPRFTVQRVNKMARNYGQYLTQALAFVTTSRPRSRTLIFVKFIADAERIAANCGRPACVISSKHTTIDNSAQVFVSTSVADAGITIPDVDFVLTCDEDYAFATDSTINPGTQKRVITTKGVSYCLDRNVITQRVGRTGRTSDGIAVIYTLTEKGGPLQLTGEDYVTSLGHMLPKVYHLLPDHVKAICPEPTYMQRNPLTWLSERVPFLPPPERDEGDVTPEDPDVSMARIVAEIVTNARIFKGSVGYWLEPEEVPSGEGTPTQVLIPNNDAIEIWQMRTDALAEQKFKVATGGEVIERLLWDWAESTGTPLERVPHLLMKMEINPITFGSLLFFCAPDDMLWSMTGLETASDSVLKGYKAVFLRRLNTAATKTVIGDRQPPPDPTAIVRTRVPEHSVMEGKARDLSIDTRDILKAAGLLHTTYLTFLDFLIDNEAALSCFSYGVESRAFKTVMPRIWEGWLRELQSNASRR